MAKESKQGVTIILLGLSHPKLFVNFLLKAISAGVRMFAKLSRTKNYNTVRYLEVRHLENKVTRPFKGLKQQNLGKTFLADT